MADAQLEAFIENDAVRWLESRAVPIEDAPKPLPGVPVLFLTRDYERELNEALDADEINRAKHILHDLKERFDESPDGTAEKSQIKSILISLYEQFRMRLERDDDQDRTDVELSRLMRSWGIQPIEAPADEVDTAAAIAQTAPRAARHAPALERARVAPIEAASLPVLPEVPARPKQDARIARSRELLEAVELDLANGDVRAAAHGYRAVRREVLGIDGGVPDDIAHRMLVTFGRVHDALRVAAATADASSSPTAAVSATPLPRELPTAESIPAPAALPPLPTRTNTIDSASFDQSIIDGLEMRKMELDTAVEQHNIALALRIYDGMRTAALHIRDPARQSDVARKLRLLHELLARLRHSTHDERGLSRQVP